MHMSDKETLIVVSKLKKYIKEKAGMSTSANVADALSDKVRQLCDEAIERAQADRRKTVMDRDF
jgi:histone H3/H4